MVSDVRSGKATPVALMHTLATPFNTVLSLLVRSPRWSRLVGRSTTVLTYTGRRSGRTIDLPVSYRRTGPDHILVFVMLPQRKTWWRNFTDEGHPVSVRLDDRDRPGHGVVVRDGEKVSVDITLDPAAS